MSLMDILQHVMAFFEYSVYLAVKETKTVNSLVGKNEV